jgi:hypothetical protein
MQKFLQARAAAFLGNHYDSDVAWMELDASIEPTIGPYWFNVSFDAFFTHILMHELMHGLGPHETAAKTVRQAMQEAGSALEEAKADIAGLFALQQLVDKGVLDKGPRAAKLTAEIMTLQASGDAAKAREWRPCGRCQPKRAGFFTAARA